MNFEVDKQTIEDLDLFGSGTRKYSVFDIFNQTKTSGGKDFLLKLMQFPSTDIDELIKRSESIKFLATNGFDLIINSAQFDFIEHYLRLNVPVLRNNLLDAFYQNLVHKLKPTNDYYLIQRGIQQLKYLFTHLKEKVTILQKIELPVSLSADIEKIRCLVENDDFSCFKSKGDKISYTRLNRLDFMIRHKHRVEILELVSTIYRIDAYISVGKVAKEKGMAYAEYLENESNSLYLTKLYHPLLSNAVPYNFDISAPHNLCFLTGPNMAGKSTFLKSLGLAVYLSHLGFPVPAQKMTVSVYHGLITTINLPDNLYKGYSHFYSEVKRVKEIALKLREKNHLFVICDELFRGTNVKDAFEASLLILESFAKVGKSTFCISTHITEVADKLKNLPNIDFKYFDIRLVEGSPVYEYKLMDGVSHERLGMYILKNEMIVEIFNSIQNS